MAINQSVRLAPCCPPPERIVHSHWMSHLPFAFWLISLLRPAILVELGSYQGASFCAFCQQIEHLGIPCEAYAVDTWQGDANMGHYGDEVHNDLFEWIKTHYPGFACMIRSSFDDALDKFDDRSIDLLHIDGFHSREAMLHDFESWLPKMSERGVILMHDICARLPGYGGVSAWKEISSRHPGFAFLHGYGLGVVPVGSGVPEELKELVNLPAEEAKEFRSLFQAQGRIYEKLFDLMETHRNEQALSASRFAAQAEQHEREAAAGQKELRAREQEIARLKDMLMDAELRSQAYENSLSWKLTAPLRKVSRYFRS